MMRNIWSHAHDDSSNMEEGIIMSNTYTVKKAEIKLY